MVDLSLKSGLPRLTILLYTHVGGKGHFVLQLVCITVAYTMYCGSVYYSVRTMYCSSVYCSSVIW